MSKYATRTGLEESEVRALVEGCLARMTRGQEQKVRRKLNLLCLIEHCLRKGVELDDDIVHRSPQLRNEARHFAKYGRFA